MHVLKGLERKVKRLVPPGWRKYFRASKYELMMDRLAPVDLIVHVGAHWGEDAGRYEGWGARTVLWIEADPATHARLVQTLGDRPDTGTRHLTDCALVSATRGETLSFHRFNGDGSSSSVYGTTDTYRTRFPHSRETGETIQMVTQPLPDILARHGIDPAAFARPMLVVDVQGHELAVLRGIGTGLQAFDLCKCEVSRVPMYAGGALFPEIDTHFRDQGFRLVSHAYARVPRHGDVLYRRGG